MFWARAKLAQGGLMRGGAIADVLFKAITGIFFAEFDHILIAGNFGDDRGG